MPLSTKRLYRYPDAKSSPDLPAHLAALTGDIDKDVDALETLVRAQEFRLEGLNGEIRDLAKRDLDAVRLLLDGIKALDNVAGDARDARESAAAAAASAGRAVEGAKANDAGTAGFILEGAQTLDALNRFYLREVRPEAYGALGGTGDERAGVQAALTAAAGGKLVISRVHRIHGTLRPSLLKPTEIEIRQGGALVQYQNSDTLQHTGTAAAAVAITAGALAGSTEITVADASGLSVADTLVVASQDVMPNIKTVREGMLRTIRDISGRTLTLDAPLYVDLPTSPFIRRVSLAPRVTITGPGEIRHASPADTTRTLVNFTYADSPAVGVSLVENGGPGMAATSCLDGEFYGHVRDLLDDVNGGHFGYGVNLGGCTRGFRVHSGSATRVRHAVTTNSGGENIGGPENCHVEASFVVRDTRNAGLDTHEPGWGNVFDANVSGSAIGVQDRARNTRITGHIDGASLYAVNIAETASDTTVDVFLSGMKDGAPGGVANRGERTRITLAVRALPANVPAINASKDYHYDGTGLTLTGTGQPIRSLARLEADLLIPADRLILTSGTPERMTSTFFWPSWALGHGTNESVGVVLQTPREFAGAYQVIARTVNLSDGSGSAALRLWHTRKDNGDSILSGVTTTSVVPVPAGARGVLKDFPLGEITISAGDRRPLLLKVERRGLEALDTLAGDIGIESFSLRKVT